MQLFLTFVIIGAMIFVGMIQYAERRQSGKPSIKVKKTGFKKPDMHFDTKPRTTKEKPAKEKPAKNKPAPKPTPFHRDLSMSKGPRDILNGISDPREASAVLLVQIAAYDGEVTQEQKTLIKDQMITHQSADDEAAESLYSFGRMAVGQIDERSNLLGKLTRPIKQYCTYEEVQVFMGMLKTVAEQEGAVSDKQQLLLDDVARLLGVFAS